MKILIYLFNTKFGNNKIFNSHTKQLLIIHQIVSLQLLSIILDFIEISKDII